MNLMNVITYRKDAELPSLTLAWYDSSGNLIDFSSDYTFELKLISKKTGAAELTKTNGIIGSATKPNIVVAWSSGDLNKTPGQYSVRLKATNIMGDRYFAPDSEPIIKIID
jgi:hypothetical protein